PTKPKAKRKQNKVTKPKSKKTPVAKKAKKKKVAKKATKTKAKTARSKTASAKTAARSRKKPAAKRRRAVGFSALEPKRPRGRSGRQAGDLVGLPRVEDADSESVAELVEEGNIFEAGAVAGVEAADEGEGEVQTHEVSEDDVPDEYLDNE